MNGLLDSLKQKKAVMISPLAFILAACGGGGSSSIGSSIGDSGSTGSTGDNTGGTPSSKQKSLMNGLTRLLNHLSC